MANPSVLIGSDVHLGATPPAMVEAFHSWLEWVPDRAGTLVLNGDLFDFWFEYRTVIPRGYSRTLSALRALVEGGVEIHMLGGNHDWWGGSFLRNEIGVHFYQEPVQLELAGRSALVAHGDGVGRGDLGYRVLRTVLRSRVTQWGFRWLHPDVGAVIARRVSRTRIRATEPTPRDLLGAEMLERWARDRLLENEGLDLVLAGHTHLPRRVEVAPRRFYLNSGDWLTHGSFVVLDPGRAPELRYWGSDSDSATADGELQSDLHRGG